MTRHRHAVLIHCCKAGIPGQGLIHDLSKYSPAEFFVGVRYFTGKRSPTEGEREALGYSRAWIHHKGRNKHHFEYWMDYDIVTGEMRPIQMPFEYVIEMFCDRVAASKIYLGDAFTPDAPLRYFQNGQTEGMIHPETARLLLRLLSLLSERGEKEAFREIRLMVRAWRRGLPKKRG